MDNSSEDAKEANSDNNVSFEAAENGSFLNKVVAGNSTSRASKLYNLDKLKSKKASVTMKSQCENMRKKLASLATFSFYTNMLLKRLPIINVIKTYNLKSFLLPDLLSGFTVGIMNIPQGMAYALLATLPPVNGLYISFFPLLVYGLLGTSKHLAIGAIAVVSLLTGGVAEKTLSHFHSNNDTSLNKTTDALKVEIVTSLALLTGIIQFIMGFTGLGILSSFFSDTFVSSYTCGSAIHVLASQLKDLFGISKVTKYEGIFKIPKTFVNLLINMNSANWKTIICSAIGITYLIIFKQFLNPRIKKIIKIEFPSELLLISLFTLASYLMDFNKNFGISIVKSIPTGLPKPQVPNLSYWSFFAPDAVIIAVISFSINLSLATLYSKKHKYPIDPTQELYAYGGSNVFGSFFSCYPCASSLSRSSVLEASNGKSQLGSVFSSLIILVVILWIGPLFEPLPKAVLACIITVALRSLLFQVKDFFDLLSISKFEAICWALTFLGVVLLDVDYGLVVGIVVSLLMVILRDQFFQIKDLTEYKSSKSYVDDSLILSENQAKNDSHNVKIFKVQHSIYFINCEDFKSKLYKKYGLSPVEKLLSLSGKNYKEIQHEVKDPDIILDFSAVNFIDTNGVKILKEIVDDFQKINVFVYICEAQDNIIKMFLRMKKLENFDQNLFITINDALDDHNNKLNNLL